MISPFFEKKNCWKMGLMVLFLKIKKHIYTSYYMNDAKNFHNEL